MDNIKLHGHHTCHEASGAREDDIDKLVKHIAEQAAEIARLREFVESLADDAVNCSDPDYGNSLNYDDIDDIRDAARRALEATDEV